MLSINAQIWITYTFFQPQNRHYSHTKEGSKGSYSDWKLPSNFPSINSLQACLMLHYTTTQALVGKVIGQQQKAYIEGDIIGSCIVNILNLMKHTNRKQMESLILLIDFKKAFDSLTHKYIENCQKMFNFGESIRRWIRLFFSNREAYILLGGE